MTRGEILNVAWTVPLWFAAVYNWLICAVAAGGGFILDRLVGLQ